MSTNEKWSLIVTEVEKQRFAKEEQIQKLWESLFVEIFGYSRIAGEIDSQRNLHIGSHDRTIPDIIIRDSATGKDLFVIELKQFNFDLNSNYKEQLFSYMSLLGLQVGILVCNKIYIFYREDKAEYSIAIPFTKDSANGELFVELFSKGVYRQEDIKDFVVSLEKSKANIMQIISDLQRLDIKKLLFEHYSAKYSADEINAAFENLQIDVTFTDLTINEPDGTPTPNPGPKKDKTKYIFKGIVYGKGRLVLAVVKDYMHDNPGTTAQQLIITFPNELQGSLGVVKLVVDTRINCRDPEVRYFLQPNEIIHTSTDDCAVCSQWGKFNIDNFIRKARRLGMEIIEINQ